MERIETIGVVGRVAPEHKVLLAETLKKKGDVVAMTGDGVNDAPAIKAADIGIAMGSGTEVAKNAGRMILSDDNFATIVYAVEQGRKLYDNLNKYIRFVLLMLVAFVLTFLGASLFNIAAGEPFTPPQVLWIHFLISAPFGVALGFDEETPGLMRLQPRERGRVDPHPAHDAHGRARRPVPRDGRAHHDRDRDPPLRQRPDRHLDRLHRLRAHAGRRRLRVPQRDRDACSRRDTFNSRRMNLIAAVEAIGAVLATGWDFLNRLLGTTQLTAQQFGLALLCAIALLVAWEAAKWVARRRTSATRD